MVDQHEEFGRRTSTQNEATKQFSNYQHRQASCKELDENKGCGEDHADSERLLTSEPFHGISGEEGAGQMSMDQTGR